MSRIIESQSFRSTAENTPIGFEHFTTPGGWGYTNYLTIKGQRAYELSFRCETCEFIFTRTGEVSEKVSIESLSATLRKGISRLDKELLETSGSILPAGKYVAGLFEIQPTLVRPLDEKDYFSHEQVDLWGIDPFWGLPHYPKTMYYRTMTKDIGNRRAFFEFVVPMMPTNGLDEEYWSGYLETLNAGEFPTALAISVLDKKQPAEWEGDPPVTEHWCLAHFLLDGHHKCYAASLLNKPITLLSFLAIDESVAAESEIAEIIEILRLER